MNHTKQSKPHSQSDDIWFKKTNYPGEWLSKKSKDIINQINQKNMKNLLFTFILFFSFLFILLFDFPTGGLLCAALRDS